MESKFNIRSLTRKINFLSVIGIAVVSHEGTGNANADRKYEVHLKDIFKVISYHNIPISILAWPMFLHLLYMKLYSFYSRNTSYSSGH